MSNTATYPTTPATDAQAVPVTTAVPALAAAFLGLFMVWGVGFSDISAVHNAAHDVRHSSGFPCH